jgi:hypothetical protein
VDTHYLNADFDLGLRPRPRQVEQAVLARQVRELSLQALLGAGSADAALIRAEIPEELIDHLHRCGIETPRLLTHPEIDPATELRPFGWSAEAIELNRRHDAPAPHPTPAAIRNVNARSFGRRLEEELSPDPPTGTVVETVEALATFLAAAPPGSEWIVKAEHGHSGLANRRMRGPRLTDVGRRFAGERLAEDDRLVVERWLPRERDYCTVFDVPFDPSRARVHETINTRDGALVGALFEPEPDDTVPGRELLRVAERVAARLADVGYFGPVCTDAFTWHDGHRRRLRPLVDLNGRRAMSDCAYRLWRRLAPDSVLYYRFFNRRKLDLPERLAGTLDALGARALAPGRVPGILLASPLQARLDGIWRRPTKLAVIFVGATRDEVLGLESWFRRRFEV